MSRDLYTAKCIKHDDWKVLIWDKKNKEKLIDYLIIVLSKI